MNVAIVCTYLIPILNAGSWLLGGTLITVIGPYELSALRTLVVALILIAYVVVSDRPSIHSLWHKSLTWWLHQGFLALTGRVIYYYFGAKALLTITPFEAILVTVLLPVITGLIEAATRRGKVSPIGLLFSIGACVMATLSMMSVSPGWGVSGLRMGHFDMLIAVVAFAVHAVYYKQNVKEPSPQVPLLAQFAISAIVLLPFANWGVMESAGDLSPVNQLRFVIYAVVCGLLPFVCMHYALKRYSSFLVLTVSILGPIFALLLKGVYQEAPLSPQFIIMTAVTVVFTFLALWASQGFSRFWQEKKS